MAEEEKRWLWMTLLLSSISIVAVVFAFWELVENQFFRDVDYVALHYLYISRGIASSLLLAFWAAWYVLHQRRLVEEELRRSRNRYRGLLELSPAAVALYDRELRVAEWNTAAERLYGFAKQDVLGRPLPTLPDGGVTELAGLMGQVERGTPVLDQESLRRDARGEIFDVQFSLLPFSEGGKTFFLEVASDIRERVRLRETLLQLEKLTTMGKMAAGTAHHLNTPLASMLLRVQMMKEVCVPAPLAELPAMAEQPCLSPMHEHLDHLESSIGFCKQFVRRLLDFARPATSVRQAEEIAAVAEAVAGFLSPSFTAKRVTLSLDVQAGVRVLGDRNQLETLLLILLSNALDAVAAGGAVRLSCRAEAHAVEIRVADNGCGIREQDLARVFEPFFTTKPIGKGTGLGLSIAQNIVTEHGGTIGISSEHGAGTEVRMRLPLTVAEPTAQEAMA